MAGLFGSEPMLAYPVGLLVAVAVGALILMAIYAVYYLFIRKG